MFIIHVAQHDGEDNAIGPFNTEAEATQYIFNSANEIELAELSYQVLELQAPMEA